MRGKVATVVLLVVIIAGIINAAIEGNYEAVGWAFLALILAIGLTLIGKQVNKLHEEVKAQTALLKNWNDTGK